MMGEPVKGSKRAAAQSVESGVRTRKKVSARGEKKPECPFSEGEIVFFKSVDECKKTAVVDRVHSYDTLEVYAIPTIFNAMYYSLDFIERRERRAHVIKKLVPEKEAVSQRREGCEDIPETTFAFIQELGFGEHEYRVPVDFLREPSMGEYDVLIEDIKKFENKVYAQRAAIAGGGRKEN